MDGLKHLATDHFYDDGESDAETVDQKKMFKIHQQIKKGLEKGLKEQTYDDGGYTGSNRECKMCNLF